MAATCLAALHGGARAQTTAPTTAPVPTPTPCGLWNGNTVDYTCQASVPCLDAQQHPLPCGLLQAPVFGVVNHCACTTCTFNDTAPTKCQGTCQYASACTLSAAAPRTCTCTPQQATPAPPPTPPPAPTPKPACGTYVGVGADGAPTTLCDPPTCASQPAGALCGIYEPALPAPSPAPKCACSTCALVPGTQLCEGTCPLKYACAKLGTTGTCGCAVQATPAPTPAPPCGTFGGNTQTWLCDAPKCPDAANPGTNVPQPRRCGILELSAATGAPAPCRCTTCHLDLATQRCAGKCQLGHVCVRGASGLAAETCQCRRKLHIIVVVVIGVTIGAPVLLAFVTLFL